MSVPDALLEVGAVRRQDRAPARRDSCTTGAAEGARDVATAGKRRGMGLVATFVRSSGADARLRDGDGVSPRTPGPAAPPLVAPPGPRPEFVRLSPPDAVLVDWTSGAKESALPRRGSCTKSTDDCLRGAFEASNPTVVRLVATFGRGPGPRPNTGAQAPTAPPTAGGPERGRPERG